jgi:ribosomal protein S18 acetylase RimI-like enzyme
MTRAQGRRDMSDVIVVEADFSNPHHAEAIVRIVDSYAREPIGGGAPLPDEVRKRLAVGLAAHPTAFALLALVDEVPVGVAIGFGGFSTFAARPLINLHDLAVLPAYRGRGIGTALLEAVARRARETDCCKVTLEVRLANPQARRLYERLEFRDPCGQPTYFLERECERGT